MNYQDQLEALLSKSVNVHYLQRYMKFIAACATQNTNDIYTEDHHILPKAKDFWPEYECFSDYTWNRVTLTAHQHFIAHWMLAKGLGGSMWNAINMMAFVTSGNQDRSYKITGKQYAIIKEHNAEQASLRFKGVPKSPEHRLKISQALTGKAKPETSQETRDKISKSVSGELNGFFGRMHSEDSKQLMRDANTGRTHTPEVIEKIRLVSTGRAHSDETKALLSQLSTGRILPEYAREQISIKAKQRYTDNPESNPMYGKQHTEEAKRLMSEARSARPGIALSDDAKRKISESKIGKPRKQVTCPHCDKVGGDGMMQRWHFDNCKQKGL